MQLRLEVLSGTGQAVFDVQAKGNVLDWALADGGQPTTRRSLPLRSYCQESVGAPESANRLA